jgi:hypothetical protein
MLSARRGVRLERYILARRNRILGAPISESTRSIRLRRLLFLSVCIALTGCATTDSAGVGQEGAAKTSVGVPANYRQLIARHLAASADKAKVLKAEISGPGEGWMGLFGGGNRPIACARVTVQGPLIQQTNIAGYTFENGRIADVFYPGGYNPMIGAVGAALQSNLTCDKLSYGPFPELARAR